MAKFGETTELLKCSFCGKSQKQVKKLIAGPGVYICDECIDLCNEIIDEELQAIEETQYEYDNYGNLKIQIDKIMNPETGELENFMKTDFSYNMNYLREILMKTIFIKFSTFFGFNLLF